MVIFDESGPDEEIKPRSELQTFFIKLVSVFLAITLFFVVSISFLASKLEESALKGGSDFWKGLELKLHRLADEKDMPEEHKARIIESLRKLSAKYRPFLDALNSAPKSP